MLRASQRTNRNFGSVNRCRTVECRVVDTASAGVGELGLGQSQAVESVCRQSTDTDETVGQRKGQKRPSIGTVVMIGAAKCADL